MQHLHSVIISQLSTYFDAMVLAACSIDYFGLLRNSEFTTPSPIHSNPTTTLSISDVAFDGHIIPWLIRVMLQQSKTDQFKQGTHVYLEKTGHQVCPVI